MPSNDLGNSKSTVPGDPESYTGKSVEPFDKSSAIENPDIGHLKILYVEDEEDLAFLVQELLSSEGHEVRIAETIEEGRQSLQKEAPDVLLLDLMLPDGNGLDILRDIKASEALKDIPVIILSGRGDVQTMQTGLECGAAAFLVKPFTMDTLVEQIGSVQLLS